MELLKNNATRQIDAQRVRDFLETVFGRKMAKVVVFADSPYTLSGDFSAFLVDTAAGDVTVNLPAGDANRNALVVHMPTAAGTGKTTLVPQGGDTVEGDASLVLHAQRAFAVLHKVTGDWRAEALDAHGLRRIGHYMASPMGNAAPEETAWTKDLMLMSPLVVPHDVKIDRLSLNVKTTGAGNNARVGVYKSNPTTLAPTDLLLDAGALSIATTGLKEATVSLTLRRAHGLYWLCALLDDGVTLYSAAGLGSNVLGVDASTAKGWSRYEAAQAYGALPASVPAGAFQVGGFPLLMARRSA
jgi:hypothetical protein